MTTILSMFIAAVSISPSAFASYQASQVTDGRSFRIVFANQTNIQRYIRGLAPATPELFAEILKFAEEMDSRQVGLNPIGTELLMLAEEVGSQLPKLDPQTKAELQPVMNSLLAQYPARTKNDIVVRLFNRFWFWSPDHLDYLGRTVRGNRVNMITTQLIWVLDQATQEQRWEFFAAIPMSNINRNLRWLVYALEYKHGYPVEMRDFKRALGVVNTANVLPKPLPILLKGRALQTTENLFWAAKAIFGTDTIPPDTCSDTLRPPD